MKTGNFAKLKEYIEAGYTPVSIARYAPPFYHGIEYKILAPSYDCLNDYKYGEHKGNTDIFLGRYMSELAKLDAKEVVKVLEELTNVKEDKIILLCFEKPEDFCHRHLAAAWLHNCAAIDCKEYEND